MEDRSVWDRLERSWALVKTSGAVVADNKALLLFPAASALASLAVIATFIIPLLPILGAQSTDPVADGDQRMFYVVMFLLYIALYFVTIFFNTALVSVALARLEDRPAGVRDGLACAVARLPRIAGYTLIAATVGLLLRAIEERVGWVGRIVVGLIGTVWTLATFLVVPILAAQDAAQDVSPIRAVRDSAEMLKRTWGENLTGTVGLSLVFGLVYVLLTALVIAMAVAALQFELQGLAVAIIACGVSAAVLLAATQAAIQGVYAAALYRYACHGDLSGGFAKAQFEGAFQPKGS
ncbi:MAG: hypothetical protein HC809_07410 [Gammaproteobacteria bacterium]|nr:hypothetical protein [Gammaproteobacteria bacterium]